MQYKGFALIDILQPCVSFNHVNTHGWYKKRVYDLEKTGYVPENFEKAVSLSWEWGDKIPTGIFFSKEKPSFTARIETLEKGPLLLQERDTSKLQQVLKKL